LPQEQTLAYFDPPFESKEKSFMTLPPDGTLNPNGVRFGSAEIYNIVEPFDEVADSLCVGQRSPLDGEERVILFLKMADGNAFEKSIVDRICRQIRCQQ
jgi:acetoacetyl-CoA synthetase